MSYCIAIKAEIVVPACPLQRGKCMWQHRETHACCYTPKEMTVAEFATLVGRKTSPNEEQIGKWMIKLRKELKDFGPQVGKPNG